MIVFAMNRIKTFFESDVNTEFYYTTKWSKTKQIEIKQMIIMCIQKSGQS